jgi:hypothetical protein
MLAPAALANNVGGGRLATRFREHHSGQAPRRRRHEAAIPAQALDKTLPGVANCVAGQKVPDLMVERKAGNLQAQANNKKTSRRHWMEKLFWEEPYAKIKINCG